MGQIQKLGDWMLFGTDGIRGLVCDSPSNDEDAVSLLIEERTISPRLLKLVGESLSRFTRPNSNVIIGWDERPRNEELVQSLTTGLHLGGCRVIHGGLCSTPALHNAVLETESAFGCMITASHNPIADSGIKIFDHEGYKTNPELEKEISELIIQIAAEDREVDLSDLELLSLADSNFDADDAHQTLLRKRFDGFCKLFSKPKSQKLVIDSSKGVAANWLADMLSEYEIDCTEVSYLANAMNENCGAGELSPTDKWTWDEAANSEHHLIKSLTKSPPNQIIAAALDGDGDRCLFIESTLDGFRVVDGDEMADHILRSAKGEWHLAASIESDLSLSTSLSRLNAKVEFTQTAVGDRWLSSALKDSNCNPIGVEDSGHIVLSSPAPGGGACLVGDGAATLFAVLCAMAVEDRVGSFPRGYKNRFSIKDTNRNLWDGKNKLADEVANITETHLGPMTRSGLPGEANLMLLEGDGISIGVRNSGTQAKTNVSLRLATGVSQETPRLVQEEIIQLLQSRLCKK